MTSARFSISMRHEADEGSERDQQQRHSRDHGNCHWRVAIETLDERTYLSSSKGHAVGNVLY
jgi:hypothetical protein